MARIFQTIEIQAPADDVWRLAGRPDCIAEFHPDVAASRLDGDYRTCELLDGTRIVEHIVDRSIVHRFYTYELTESASPIRWYRGCLAVRGHGDHSHVDWDLEIQSEPQEDTCLLARGIADACGQALGLLRERLETKLAAA
ncbi:MAG: SRPBCC family protein [Gaiellaceae bacterium]